MSEQKKYTDLEVVDDERKIDSLVIDIVRSMTPTDLERVLSVHEAPDQTWSISFGKFSCTWSRKDYSTGGK